ncbi:CrcB family protein [Leucobacter massiliensis]|uniref:Fluoride-specific ion channel FluC n=1 Tax=Leucobacter massiliensis TaxID=1686285 RepID=A0A2S9QQ83_9MICO|nr:CrcB family protein [Leucobacter massiliensis]PRI11732.1 hypothetical protein B4915_04630 [Leucobacter massiliensis]
MSGGEGAGGGRLSAVALVAAGGAAGSLARYVVTLAVGDTGAFPVAVFGINVLGGFLLGLLLESLAGLDRRRGAPGEPTARLLLGTGVLGGFTTYSLLASDIAGLLLGGQAWVALGYGAASLAAGGLAAWLGVRLGGALTRGAAE